MLQSPSREMVSTCNIIYHSDVSALITGCNIILFAALGLMRIMSQQLEPVCHEVCSTRTTRIFARRTSWRLPVLPALERQMAVQFIVAIQLLLHLVRLHLPAYCLEMSLLFVYHLAYNFCILIESIFSSLSTRSSDGSFQASLHEDLGHEDNQSKHAVTQIKMHYT